MNRAQPPTLWEKIWKPFAAHFREPQLSLIDFEDEVPDSDWNQVLATRRRNLEELKEANHQIHRKISDISQLLEQSGDAHE